MIRDKVLMKIQQLQKQDREERFQLKRVFKQPIHQLLDQVKTNKITINTLLYRNPKLTEQGINFQTIDTLLNNCNSNEACLELLALIILRDNNRIVTDYLLSKQIKNQIIQALILRNRL